MPYDKVMPKFAAGTLRSGSGRPVKKQKQAVAIMLSEKQKADEGDEEYQPTTKPPKKVRPAQFGKRKESYL